MFATLIESRAVRARRPAAHAISFAAHAIVITGAVVVTHQVASVAVVEPLAPVLYVSPRVDPVEPATRAPRIAPILRGFQVLVAPVMIPDVLPPIDITRAVTNPDDFSGRLVPGGRANGVLLPAGAERVYSDTEVEKLAAVVPGTATPGYPDALRGIGLEGEVVVEFVIDTLGRAELPPRVTSSSNPRFTESVIKALTKARFFPAEVGGKKVKQLVRMPFVFSIR